MTPLSLFFFTNGTVSRVSRLCFRLTNSFKMPEINTGKLLKCNAALSLSNLYQSVFFLGSNHVFVSVGLVKKNNVKFVRTGCNFWKL